MKVTASLPGRHAHPERDGLSGVGHAGFANSLRERTASLHRKAERTGIVGAMIAGQVTRAGYALFLRNLLPAYCALEAGLARQRSTLAVTALFREELARAPAIEADLVHLAGPDWADRLALLPQGVAYADRISAAAEGEGFLLIAHAYARYLGDLGGGQVLKRLLGNLVDFDGNCLSFYEFLEIADVGAFARDYREALDAAAAHCADVGPVIDEAVVAFELNIDLSEAALALASATTL
jgi:heme oxygenase